MEFGRLGLYKDFTEIGLVGLIFEGEIDDTISKN